MKFDYSYRAFLISSLLVGNLVLLLLSVKLGGLPIEEEASTEAIEYIDLPEIETLPEDAASANADVRTNRAYNEAERFIAEAEKDHTEISDATSAKLAQIDQVLENGQSAYELPEDELKEVLDQNRTESSESRVDTSEHRSTVSFSLKDRTALYFPNPVYTCSRGGKIVISITVDGEGEVTKAEYNSVLSASTNQCLIDQALEYAKQTRFSTSTERASQLGIITYRFPGQE